MTGVFPQPDLLPGKKYNRGDYNVSPTYKKCVLLFGQLGSGKSTWINYCIHNVMDHVDDEPGLARANRDAEGVTQKWTLYAWPAMQLMVMDTRGLNDPKFTNEQALLEVLRGIDDNQLEIGAALLCINGSLRMSEDVMKAYNFVDGLHPLMTERLHIWIKHTADCELTDIARWKFKKINGASKHPWPYTFNAVDVMRSLLKEPTLEAQWYFDECSNCNLRGDRRLLDTEPCRQYLRGWHENFLENVTQVTTKCHKGPFVEVMTEHRSIFHIQLPVLHCQNCNQPKHARPCDSNTTGGPVTCNPVRTERHIGFCHHRGSWFENLWTKGHYKDCGHNNGDAGCHCDYCNLSTSEPSCEITITGQRLRCTECKQYDQTGFCPMKCSEIKGGTHAWVRL